MKLQIAKVTGFNTDQKAAQTVSSIQGDITFLAVLDITCDDAFTKGRQFLSDLLDEFFSHEESIGSRLSNLFAEAQKRLADVESPDLLLSAVSGKALYLIFTGNVAAFLKRGDQFTRLINIASPGQLISGFLEEGDRVIFTTNSLLELLGDDFEKVKDFPLLEWEEQVSAKIGVDNMSNHDLAGIILEAESDVNIEIPNSYKKQEIALPTQKFNFPNLFKFLNGLKRTSTVETKEYYLGDSNRKNVLGSIKKIFPKSGRGKLVLAILLILVVLLGVGYQYKAKQDAGKLILFQDFLAKAQGDYDGALGLQTLNPVESKVKLDSAKDNVNKALALKPEDKEALELKNKLDVDTKDILQQFQTEFPLFLDLDLVKKDFKATRMSLSTGKLLVLDYDTKTLATIDLTKKSQQILSGKNELGEAKAFSINGGSSFVYSLDKGLIKIDNNNQKVTVVAKKDPDLGDIVDIAGFSSNVYILDSLNNKIWKYLPAAEGFSDKRDYFNKDVKVDLAGTKRMQIESSIYVLKNGGEILRYTKGASDFFSIGGLDKGIKDPISFFVSSETDNLYILDSGNSRLVVLDKVGAYRAQYQGDKFRTASDLVVDEEGKKVYLLDSGKIYTVDLK